MGVDDSSIGLRSKTICGRAHHIFLARKGYEVATYDGKVVASGDVPDDVLAQLRAGKLMVRQNHVRGPEGKQEHYECNRHSCF
jgi:hypothetical protein